MNGECVLKPIDVIMVNYNSTKQAMESINSIKRVTNYPSLNIIIVDNASTDSPEILNSLFQDVSFLFNGSNLGFSKAVNQAARKSRSPYILIINPDTTITNDFFADCVEFLEKNKNIGVVGARILDHDGCIQGSARTFPNYWSSIFGRKSPLTKIFPTNPFTKKEFPCFQNKGKEPLEVDWVSGACMMIRREAFDMVGGFDESFFLYWEDTDICKRIKDAGYKTVYYPKAEIKHAVGASSSTTPTKSIFHFHHSCFKLFKKYCSNVQLAFLPIILFGLSFRCAFVIFLNLFGGRLIQIVRNLNALFNFKFSITKNFFYSYIFFSIYVLAPKEFIAKKTSKNPSCKVFEKPDRTYKTRILRVISRLNIGGASLQLLSENLDQEKYESNLIIGSVAPGEASMGYLLSEAQRKKIFLIKELQRELHFPKDLISLFRIIQLLLSLRPDIVHTNMAKAGAIGRTAVFFLNLFRNKKIKTVHTFHGHIFDGYFGKLQSNVFIHIERFLAIFTDAIIAISTTQKWELSERYKICSPDKIHIINLGFDLSKFQSLSAYKGLLRQKIKAKKEDVIIGIVGRLVPIKNHKMFIDAAKILLDKDLWPLRFVIVGDGELRKELEEYTKVKNIQKQVSFYGWEKDIKKVYPDLNILALTSNNEGTPVSIIEAMASNVPVITTGVGGVKDLLGAYNCHSDPKLNGFRVCERGILCPKNDAIIFAKGIEYIINNIFFRSNDMLLNAREFVFKNYSASSSIPNLETLYLSLTAQ